jgi:acetyl esterase/lipase
MLPARTIPIPTSISPEAQSALATSRFASPQWPPPTDKAAWRRLVRKGDASTTALYGSLPAFPGTITARSVGAATVYDLIPQTIASEKRDRAILYIHGGACVMGGGELVVKAAQPLATEIQIKVYAATIECRPTIHTPLPWMMWRRATVMH